MWGSDIGWVKPVVGSFDRNGDIQPTFSQVDAARGSRDTGKNGPESIWIQ